MILQSRDPLAKNVPLLLKATEKTLFVCPVNVFISSNASIFHNFIIPSSDPLAKILPFGLKEIDKTEYLGFSRVAINY